MNNKQKTPLSILADREVFDYLKEKIGERKTRTEAYCDLLDKALSGFVSPFLRKQDYDLQPHQCHVTVSDLASDWHWHRATVRSFLDTIEAFGLLERIRLAKSVVITMAVQSGQPAEPHQVQERPDFAGQLREALSDWVVGRTTESEVGTRCGQLVSQAMSETADRAAGYCPDSRFDTAAGHAGNREAHVRETALGCIAHAALQKNLRKSRFADTLQGSFSTPERRRRPMTRTSPENASNRFAIPSCRSRQEHRTWRIDSGMEKDCITASNPPPSVRESRPL